MPIKSDFPASCVLMPPMRRCLSLLLLTLAVLVLAPGCSRNRAPGPIQRVIIISVDGLMPEVYLHPDAHGLQVPTLRELARNGARSDGARSVFPTLTYPAHTSIATGTNPGTHGIVSNETLDPEDRNDRGWRWYTEDIRVPTLWDEARRRGLRTALVNWPVTVGAQADRLAAEYWRAGNSEDIKLLKALSTPGLLDEVAARFPGFWQGYMPPRVGDASITDIAVHILETERPHLLMLHIIDVDHFQHGNGIFSPEAVAAIENADAQIARVIDASKKAGLWDETALVVVSDHGFAAFQQRFRPGIHLARQGLVTLDSRGRVTAWKAAVLPTHGLAYVYVKDPADAATRQAALDAFTPLAGKPDSGIARIYTSQEIRAMGGDPEAAFALVAQGGVDFANGYSGELFSPVGSVAGHGLDPSDPRMRASLLMHGPGIAPQSIEGARLIDVAPTVARWLGLRLDKAEGRPLLGDHE